MYKILISTLVMFFCGAIATAQIKDENPAKQDSTKQLSYSESTPYQSRKIEDPESGKKKKKKSKKDSEDKQTPSLGNENSSKPLNGGQTIRIPLYVYDRKNNPVANLQNSDIEVLIDDREQEIAAFETAKPPLNLLLIVDTSPSLAYKDSDLKNVIAKFVEALNPEDKIQIIKFSEDLDVLNEPTNDPQILQKAVKKIESGGGTSLYEAIETICKKYLAPNDEQPTIILLTDGIDTTSIKANYFSSLIAPQKKGAAIFPFYFDSYEYFQKNKSSFQRLGARPGSPVIVGLTEAEYQLGRAYLHDIAALSGGRTFVIKNLSEIKQEDLKAAFKVINPQYYILINSTETGDDFQRKQIKVRVNRPNLIVQARGSYITGKD